jgi:hypothetical protein
MRVRQFFREADWRLLWGWARADGAEGTCTCSGSSWYLSHGASERQVAVVGFAEKKLC